MPLIFFYHNNNPFTPTHHDHLCQSLMHSLSQALALFYPLAGKIDPDNFAIDCDDSGAEFVAARVQARLDDVRQDPRVDQLGKLLPVDPFGEVYTGEGTVFMVQFNTFECGGVAVAACIAHHLADFTSFVDFMNAWAAISRGEKTLEFEREFGVVASHFPARDLAGYKLSPDVLMTNDNFVTKMFLLNKEKLSSLKKAARSSLVNNPTRVESISAFIWRHLIERKLNEQPPWKKVLSIEHIVNIRTRMDPSLQLQKAFGNAIFLVPAYVTDFSDGIPQLNDLTARVRAAIRKVDAEYIEGMENGYLSDLEELSGMLIEGGVEGYVLNSRCRFPVYEVEFGWGWGKPAWVCTTTTLMNNLSAILTSSKTEEEIEVLINLPPEDAEFFEREFNLIVTMN